MSRDIKMTLAGDTGVGKSSLVTALVRDSWAERVQKVVPEILLPLDVTQPGVTTRIVDTAADRRSHLESSLRSSHVIVLVYSISSPTSFDRIPTFWLPFFRSLGINVPVILVGNKIDLRRDQGPNEALEEELAPVMAEFKEVETCIETSVKEGINVSEVFWFAQKAVLYPMAPLYDSKTHNLKEACVTALQRIFKLCDADKDHLLSDDELNDFQRRCFGAPLQQQELEGIKDLVFSAPIAGEHLSSPHSDTRDRESRLSGGGPRSASSSTASYNEQGARSSNYCRPASSNGGSSSYHHPHLRDDMLTMSGWLHLHTLFIQRGRHETTWAVLTSYGYNHSLALEPTYLNPPSFHVPSDCTVELSPYGYSFLTEIFEAHDKDRDGALCADEMAELFETAPDGGDPWTSTSDFPRTTVTDENGAVTLQGWLAQWSMTTLLDYKVTLANLAYLGYPNLILGGESQLFGNAKGNSSTATSSPPSLTTALKFTRKNSRRLFSSSSFTSSSSTSPSNGANTSTAKKKKKRGDPAERSVFLAYVFGAAGSGKSSLLRSLVGRPFEETYTPTTQTRSVVSAIEQGGLERHLILQEFGSRYESEVIRSPTKLAQADLIILVWDSSDTNSFSHIANLRSQYPGLGNMPSLFVATKADLDLAQQRHEVQPDVYCRKLELSQYSPLHVSALEGRLGDLFGIATGIAVDPRSHGAIPGGERRIAGGIVSGKTLVILGVIGIVGGGTAYWWMKKGGDTSPIRVNPTGGSSSGSTSLLTWIRKKTEL